MTPYITAAAIVFAAFATALVIYMRLEAGNAVLEVIRLTNRDDGLRVVQISDVHIKVNSVPPAKIISLIREAAPHIVVLTGDFIDSSKDSGRFYAWMDELTAAIGNADFYLCYGNHDYVAFSRAAALMRETTKRLKRRGGYVVENWTRTFERCGKTYAITGFSDYYTAPYYSVQKTLKGIPKNVHYSIGFSHNPDLAIALDGPRPDLLLLGHFHGGQIWMPFSLEYTCLRKERLCKTGVRRGLHNYGGRLVYISRGLGCVLFPLRLGSRPEVTLFIIP